LLIRYMVKSPVPAGVPWLGVILGGALGNLLDRIMMGKVTDFLDMGASGWRWPTFNVADIAIVIGGIAVFLVFRKARRLEVSSEEEE
ncbi:MAG TPA: signal peptidase II, partial [Candidatus Sabulitectum sp.]|nr:signal peptidase II [Candidatus Sabulitectum sp.]